MDDPSEVVLLFQADGVQKARDFVSAPDVPKVKEKTGIVALSDICFPQVLTRTMDGKPWTMAPPSSLMKKIGVMIPPLPPAPSVTDVGEDFRCHPAR